MTRSRLSSALFAAGVFMLLPAGAVCPALAQDARSGPAKSAGRGPVIMKYNEDVPLGTHRFKDESGREYIIYSTGGPSERSRMIRESAREKEDRAWEMLSTIIIDTRSDNNSESP